MTPYNLNSLFLRMRATSIHCFLTWYRTGEASQKVFTAIDMTFLPDSLEEESYVPVSSNFTLPVVHQREIMVISKSYWCAMTFHQLKKKLRVKCRRFFLLLLKGTQVHVNRSHVGSLLKLETSKQITDFHWVNHIMQKWGDGITTIQSS